MKFEKLGMTLSLPYNFQPDFIDKVLLPLAKYTEEVYLSVHWAIASTARTRGAALSRSDYLNMVDILYRAAAPRGIRLNFVANTDADPRSARLIVDEAVALAHRYDNTCFTIRSLETAVMLKKELPSADITPSTLSMVDSVIAAMYWRRAVNPKVLMIAREINRKPLILQQLKDMGFRLKMIPQDNCIPYCPVLHEHLNAIRIRDSLSSVSTVDIPVRSAECRPFAMGVLADPDQAWLIAQQNVLPGHLPKLKGLVDIIKLEGRQLPSDQILRKARYYLDASSLESYAPIRYIEPPEAWDRIAHCDRNCFSCDWCRQNIRFNTSFPNRTAGPKVERTVAVARIQVSDGPVLLIFPLGSGLPAFMRAGDYGVAYQARELTPRLQAWINAVSELVSRMSARDNFSLQSFLHSPDLSSIFKEYEISVSLEHRSLNLGAGNG